jgi:hypothetical protein
VGVDDEGPVDDVGESALEGSQGFGCGVAHGGSLVSEGLGIWVVAELGNRDAVDGGVELPVACARQSMSIGVPGLGRKWGAGPSS